MIGRKLTERLSRRRIDGKPIERVTLNDMVAPEEPPVSPSKGDCRCPTRRARRAGRWSRTAGDDLSSCRRLSGEAEIDSRKAIASTSTARARCSRRSAQGRRIQAESRVHVVDRSVRRAVPGRIPDEFHLTPLTSYGTQKAMNELLLADYSRRGFLDGVGIRLPAICVRPGKPNTAASGFFSGIIREPLAGQEAVLPVAETVRHTHASTARGDRLPDSCSRPDARTARRPHQSGHARRVLHGRRTDRCVDDALPATGSRRRIRRRRTTLMMRIVGGGRRSSRPAGRANLASCRRRLSTRSSAITSRRSWAARSRLTVARNDGLSLPYIGRQTLDRRHDLCRCGARAAPQDRADQAARARGFRRHAQGRRAGRRMPRHAVPHVKPGVTDREARPAGLRVRARSRRDAGDPHLRGYRRSICTSINHVVCHGIPNEKPLREGDIVNIDVTLILDGWHGDSSRMYAVGEIPRRAERLVEVTYEA